MSEILETHREFLSDERRLAAFQQAIQAVVRPGDTVLDLGCGTGILGLFACRAGAARVYSVDAGGIIDLARRAAQENGFADRMVLIRGLSTRIELPEKVDVVVADQIGHFGYEAGLFQSYADARTRFLKTSGRLLPAAIDLMLAPVECPEQWDKVNFWNSRPAGMTFDSASQLALNNQYIVGLRPTHLLCAPRIGLHVDLHRDDLSALKLSAAFRAEREGTLHGIGGWFSAALAEGIYMTNSPVDTARRINRRNVILPIREPVPLRTGDDLHVQVAIRPAENLISWQVQIDRQAAAAESSSRIRFNHSKLIGELLSQEDLERARPSYRPRLGPWGVARLTVLQMADGSQSREEIEHALLMRQPDLFRNPQQAAAFVTEVLDYGTI